MRLYDNPLITIAYFFGAGVKKLQRAIDNRDRKKNLDSAVQFLSSSEEERKRRIRVSEKREKWALRSFIFAVIGIFLGYLTIDSVPVLSLIILVPTTAAVIYGLWYSFFGKYL